MIKVTRQKPAPVVVPPSTILIELDLETASELSEVLGQIGVGFDGILEGPNCRLLSKEEKDADTRFGGHSYKYKRVIDALSNHLRGLGI